MKKALCLLLAVCMMLPVIALAEGETVKIGQVQYAAHGTSCFAVLTVAVQGDVIVAAHIDEYQFLSADSATGVPNSDQGFGQSFPEGMVLGSKRVNNDMYSANMKDHAGATQTLVASYEAIEAYVTGKTIAELEAAVEGQEDSAAFLEADVVSGSTLADTLGYVKGLIEAAKAAE